MGIPVDGILNLAILRNGEQIGRHVIRFERRGDSTIVRIVAEVDYRVASIPLFTFRHTALETWREGKLIAMSAKTNDDEDDFRLEFSIVGDAGSLTMNGETVSFAATSWAACLWNNAVEGYQTVIDPMGGEMMKISVTSSGVKTFTIRAREIPSFRYNMRGEIQCN